jgi:hypothetical protein
VFKRELVERRVQGWGPMMMMTKMMSPRGRESVGVLPPTARLSIVRLSLAGGVRGLGPSLGNPALRVEMRMMIWMWMSVGRGEGSSVLGSLLRVVKAVFPGARAVLRSTWTDTDVVTLLLLLLCTLRRTSVDLICPL